MLFGGPAAFLLLLEGVLAILHVGYPTSFFIQAEQPGMLASNIHFGWHYQQRTLTEPHPCLIPRDKAEGTIRIFVLGGSAAMGMPDPSFGFQRILETMLRRQFPERRVEVVNAAMRGINSHVLVPIARECAGLEPDLFIIYMGNNELNGLYGPRTAVSFFGRHPALIPLFHGIKQTRTGQLLRRVLRANPEAYQGRSQIRAAEFFEKHRTALDDPAREYVYRNFRRNLEQICGRGLDAGAGVIVSTVAVNLRDCPPLGSLHRSDLPTPQREIWDRIYSKGVRLEERGNTAGAATCYEQAAAIDDHYAELHFRLARCRRAAGERDSAKHHFTRARDWDALQFRADSRLNAVIREVAEHSAGRVRLADAEAAMAASQRCPDGIPGKEFFYEHVHLRFDGDYELAQAVLPAVLDSLRGRGFAPMASAEVPTREQCARELAFTAWDEVNTAASMVQLTAKPPFTGQADHARRQAEAQQAVTAVTDQIDGAFVDRVIQAYQEAIEARPDDWQLRYNLATLLHQLERPAEAAVHFDYVVRTLPHVAPFRVLLGYALAKSGRLDPAIDQFREALKRDRRYKPAREALEWARAAKKGALYGRSPAP